VNQGQGIAVAGHLLLRSVAHFLSLERKPLQARSGHSDALHRLELSLLSTKATVRSAYKASDRRRRNSCCLP
jgi:hypothetical protein